MKNQYNRYVAILYVLALLCSFVGCSKQSQLDHATEPETLENPFLVTTVPTEPAMPELENVTSITFTGLPAYTLDEVGHYVSYEGGEMQLPYTFNYTGNELSVYGVAIMLFLDGRLQPFKLTDDGAIQYVHRIYPEAISASTEVTQDLDLIFTPVTGQRGDVMDLSIVAKTFPDWEWGNDSVGLNSQTSSITTRLKFAQTPPQMILPETRSRIVDWSISYTDATLAEYESWSADSLNKLSTCLRIAGHQDNRSDQGYRYLYDVTANVPVELTMEMVNTSGVEYGVVLFVDSEPVSTETSELIYVDKATAQRTTLSVTLDLSDFDDQSQVYAFIIPRNYLATFGYTSDTVVDVVDTVTYYLFAESDWADVMRP